MKKLFIIGLTALLIPGILAGCSKAEQAKPLPFVEDQADAVLPVGSEEAVDEARMIAEEIQTQSEEAVEALETPVEEAEAQLAGLTALTENLKSESQEALAALEEKMDRVPEMEEVIEEVGMDAAEEAVENLEEVIEEADMDIAEEAVEDLEEVIEDVDMDVAEEAVAGLEEKVAQVSDAGAKAEGVMEDIDMDAVEENLRKLLAAEEAEEMDLGETEDLIKEESDDLVAGSEPTKMGDEAAVAGELENLIS